MAPGIGRRTLLGTTLAALVPACARDAAPPARAEKPPTDADPLATIEAALGGRAGVFAIDSGSNAALAHRADERFAMCSTFKWTLAARALRGVDRGELRLEDAIPYGEADLLEYAPTTRAHLASGSMTVGALAEAAVVVSDNAAANLLLARVGGPAGLTTFFRQLGDDVTRLDRNEPTLNTNQPRDPRDTTSPRSMVRTLRAVLLGDVLTPTSRERLLGWMKASRTGSDRLRAGLPAGWAVGDKTGTGNNGASNDVAIAIPPGRSPILIASYLSDGPAEPEALNAAHAAIARAVVARLTVG